MHVEDLVCLQKRVTRAAAKVQVQAALELSLQAREPTHIIHTPLVTSNLRTPHAARRTPHAARRTPQPIPRTNREIFVVTPSHGLNQPLRRGHPRLHQLEHLPKGSVAIRPFQVSQKGRRRQIRQIRPIVFPPWLRSFAKLSTTWAHERLKLLAGSRQNESGMGLGLVGLFGRGVRVVLPSHGHSHLEMP